MRRPYGGVTDAVEFTELLLHDNLLVGPGKTSLALPLDPDGCLQVPDTPGLGVTFEKEQVQKHSIG